MCEDVREKIRKMKSLKKTGKNVATEVGCIEAKILFTNTKHFLKELDFDRSVCMAAICFRDLTETISS